SLKENYVSTDDLRKLQAEQDVRKKDIQKLQDDVALREGEISSLKARISELESNLSTAPANEGTALSAELHAARQEISQLQDELASLRQQQTLNVEPQLDSIRIENEKLSNALREKSAQLVELQLELDKAREAVKATEAGASSSDRRTSLLENEKGELEKTVALLTSEKQRLESSQEQLIAKLGDYRKSLQQAADSREENAETRGKLEKRIEALRAALEDTQRQLTGSQSTQVTLANLREERDRFEQKLRVAEDRAKSFDTEIERKKAIESDNATLRQQVAALSKELETVREKMTVAARDSVDLEALRKKADEYRIRTNQLESQLTSVGKELSEREKQLVTTRSIMQQEAESKQKELERVRATVEKADTTGADLRKKLEQSEASVNELQNRLATLERDNKQASDKLVKESSDNGALTARV
ncbi:MAG: hypothetical protein KDD44_13650, partial [Bdellovibrionales bacterium]|nr:hypothetical protein [Bdellovibrionales bacterium]